LLAISLQTSFILAQEAESSGGGSALAFLFPLVILGGLFYVLLILPQRRKQKKMEALRADIAVGDEVRTIGGILGTVIAEDDEVFTIDIGGQDLRVVKKAVAERVESEDS
jgi:preprotein translocase subunit YajC